ncbi:DUF4870 domain-containing protein [Agrococcus sp. SGAir0287]|uniref:DUF4870 domain-containing protein n=1 Tax=Agrococcus sp. SGAir0287 TaxID=2070347 RepID=UPI0010CCC8E0|nr:DUF4870 domain-containing protein [Agrococcus sp. SGAir0287]QCR19455.1 DUF4870 domain-containing protein [Agrococcus sp. SGAir0287]
MTDPNGPAATPDEPQAPQFGAPGQGTPAPAPAPGEPAQPFSSPAPGAVPPQPGAGQQPYGAPGQQPYGAPGQQAPYGAPQYGAPGQPQYGAPAGAPMSPQDEKQWAMFGHLGGILWVVSLGWLGPLIVFLMYKDRSPFVRQESKEALNFQLLMTIITVGGSIVVSILTAITFGLASILYLIVFAAPIVGIIFAIIGGVRVNGGGSYRYPFNWRIIK